MIIPPTDQRRAPAPGPVPRMRVGYGARVKRSTIGESVSMQNATWHHPWFTSIYWDGAQKEWVAVVRPGFVNGRAPVVQTTARRMQSTPSFLAPVTAWDGAADIAQAAELASESETETVDADTPIFVPIYRNPMLSLPWREMGAEGAAIPAYFLRRVAWIASKGRSAKADSDAWTASGRKLFSADVVLHQPRAALTSKFDFPVDLVTGSSIVTQTLSVREAASNDRLKIETMSEYKPPESISAMDKLLGNYEEPTWDELLIARVFLLSPPNAAVDSSADGSCIPFVQHSLFWNLSWYQPLLRQLPSDRDVTFTVPLAFGLGQMVINSILAPINDMVDRALDSLVSHSLGGTFWTPTGGGSDSAFPEIAATQSASGQYGFDKDLRLKASRVAALGGGVLTDALDPVFPYRAHPFQTSLL